MSLHELQMHLRESQVNCEIAEYTDKRVILSIEWGDWKHDHGYADDVMSRLGYTRDEVVITEEDGSEDCYSADHYYTIPE